MLKCRCGAPLSASPFNRGSRRCCCVRWLLHCCAQPLPLQAAAGSYPTKPIRFICPYAPGGAGDIFTRTIAQKLTEALGQTVVVDNRAGANGGIGTDLVAKAPADGYTLLMGNSGPMTVNPHLYRKLPYDPVRDFAPITQGTSYMYVLVVPPAAPVKSLPDFIKLLQSKPGQMTYGSTGIGGGNHLSGELFNLMTSTKSIHVPYTGSALALAALLGGQINYMFDTVITAVPQLRGKLRAIGVSGAKRASALPDVPTLQELGLKDFALTQWQAVVAPAGTPRPLIERLNREVVKALKMPDVIDRLATQGGNELVGNTPEQFAQVINSDLALYGRIVKAAGIQPQ
ncbi:MAG: tripartite tricarboxylate transporter substrate binding protein [Betaproteobacteria bacterium]|nr:MAG: tripartite tricarboxylate transporter substrate binding protein [Betaproteobacteria bacterium]